MPSGAESKLENLSGRRELWGAFTARFLERPILGYGYAVAARTKGAFYVTNTHNIVFAVLLGTGLVGALTCIWTLALAAKESLRPIVQARSGAIGAFCALSAGLVNGMSISLICEGWMCPSFVFVMIYAFFLLAVVRPQWQKDPRAVRSPLAPKPSGRAFPTWRIPGRIPRPGKRLPRAYTPRPQ
jgi:O-antigen ligase